MRATVSARVDEQGNLHPEEPLSLPAGSRVLIAVFDPAARETTFLSEASLVADWNRPEEDEAWSHLAQAT
jgi:hypothetical protein